MTTITPERVRERVLKAVRRIVNYALSNGQPCDEDTDSGSAWDAEDYAEPLLPIIDDLLAALAASEARVRELRECLSTLVYLHDKGDRVDESWWQHAREILAASTEPKETTDHE